MLTLTGQLLAGKYRVGARLGSGGMGEVYEGLQEALGRPVAIKVMSGAMANDPILLERFQREARAVAALGHPHIVSVTDFQDNPGEPPFIVMERLVGESLGDLLEREPMVDPMRACRVAEQTLSALAAAHESGLVHRDVKPDNIFLCRTDVGGDMVKLLDFGVAKALEESKDGKLTSTGAVVGTLVYMAPEQARGEPVDARADIYALGAVLYHMLAGQTPFVSQSPARLLSDVASSRPVPLSALRPDLDGGLLATVARAMEPAVEQRYPTARAMMAHVGALLRGETPKTEPVFSHAETAYAPNTPRIGTPRPTPYSYPPATPVPQTPGHYHPTSGAGVVMPQATYIPSAPPPAQASSPRWPFVVAAMMVLAGGAAMAGASVYLRGRTARGAPAEALASASVVAPPIDLVAATAPRELSTLAPAGSSAPALPSTTGVTALSVPPPTTTTAVANTASPSLAGLTTGQLVQQMVKAHTQGDGRTCLDAYDRLRAQPDFSDPADGYAIIHGDCLMAAGRCDEGRKVIRDYYGQPRPALQQMSATQIDTTVSYMAMTYCPASQLSATERVTRAHQLLIKAQGAHDSASEVRYADEMAALLPSVPHTTDDERHKLVSYEFSVARAYGNGGRCTDASRHFRAECTLNASSNVDACTRSLLASTACKQTP